MEAIVGLLILAALFVIWLARKASQVGNAPYDGVGEVHDVDSAAAPQRLHGAGLSESASAAVHICSELIGFQLRATCCNPYTLSQDRWALGYVWGFLDGVLRRMGIDASEDRASVYSAFFSTLFNDPDINATLFTLSLRSQDMPAFEAGAKKGGQDALQDSDAGTPAFGLSEHLFAVAREEVRAGASAASQQRTALLTEQRK
jgi:hypothetical protein